MSEKLVEKVIGGTYIAHNDKGTTTSWSKAVP